MALVGDLIIAAREIFPDLPSSLIAAPGAEISVAALATPTGYTSLPTGNNYVRITYLNPWGETLPKAEQTVSLAAIQTLRVTGTLPAGVTGLRVYHGVATGAETQFFQGSTLPFTIDAAEALAGFPPTVASAFLPDSNGSAVSAATVYRWIGEAYDKMGLATKGVRDQTGVQMLNGMGVYTLTGRWLRIHNIWYDGWLMSRQGTYNFYYHNTARGISWMADVTRVTNTGIDIAVWPQANRTGATTTLSVALSAIATSASIAVSTAFLPLGIVRIGTEVCEYSTTGAGTINGLIRGIGGTRAQAWPIGTAVTELNLRILGMRIPTKPTIGDAYRTVDVPFGVESILTTYLLHKFREAEQEGREAQRLLAEFYGQLTAVARQNRQLAGPVQVGGAARETYGSGLGGGWFIP